MARVLVVRQGYVPLDPRVRRDLEALRRAGHEVDVLARRRKGMPNFERTEFGRIWRLPGLPGRGGPILYLAQYAAFLFLATLMTSAMQLRRRYDLVQVHSLPDTLVFCALLPRLMGTPVLLDLQEAMPEFFATKFKVDLDHPLVRVVAAFEQASVRFASHVVTCTSQMKEAFVKRGAPAEKITVVLNSADEEVFSPRSRPARASGDEFVLVCHGTIEERYGHDEAVSAVALLRDEIPGLKLRVYGQGSHLPAVRSLAAKLGVEDRVWFNNDFVPLDELLDGIAGADVGIVAMRRDAFRDLTHCNKMFDFISMQVPAAVSRTRSVEEYFDDDCFELFESGDANDLAHAIRTLWQNPARRDQLVSHAAAVNEPYRWPHQRKVYLETVSALLGRRQPDTGDRTAPLCAANTPAAFWKLLSPTTTDAEWADAVAASAHLLPPAAAAEADDLPDLLDSVLAEGQFGSRHWELRGLRRLYYDLKPYLPRRLKVALRRAHARRERASGALDWPAETRYADFLIATLEHVLKSRGLDHAMHSAIWPGGARMAFVLTHDVELQTGHDFVPKVVELEERYGFRSSFNFVPDLYPIDQGLLEDLHRRGFEVGVHDLRHDGKLFRSKRIFDLRAGMINDALAAMKAAGFRTALHHRNPVWMQSLEADYDLSFFDTDPFEPVPGGTMSLWPFILGRFVELPYTLVQDYTLVELLGETTPRLWLDKVDLLASRNGMALLNTHPDYLRGPRTWSVYEAFLAEMAERRDVMWHALPRDVARWWRTRHDSPDGAIPPGGSVATFHARESAPVISQSLSTAAEATLAR